MESLVSLEGYDPELRDYLQRHRWPSVLEALLTGLTVMTPRDPWRFVSQSLVHIKATNATVIPRDLFVDPASRSLLQRGPLRSLLTDSDGIDEEQLERAYQFQGRHLCQWCFRAWLEFHALEQKELAEYRERLKKADHHYVTVVCTKLFSSWRDYTRKKKFRRQLACGLLTHMHQLYVKGRLLAVWLKDAREMKQTRTFFEQQQEMEAEGSGWTWPEGNDPIALMDRSITIKIFTHVDVRGLMHCRQVCHSWKTITEDPRLWNRMNFALFGKNLRDSGLVRQLHTHRPVLGHLSLQGCSNLSPDTLKIIGECPNLQDLNLSECDITDDVISIIAQSCTGLLYLNLSYCCVSDNIIRLLASHCANLSHLSMAHSYHFTVRGLRSIERGRGCRRLVYLDLSGCNKLTAEGLQCVGRGCPILNTLLLDDIPTITDTIIRQFASSCHTLRCVSLLGGSRLSDRSIRSLVQHNKKIKTIKIENNSIVTDTSLRLLSRTCRDLHHVYLAGCSRLSDKGLQELKRLKRLQVLNIADCTRVSDLGVRYIVEGAYSSELKELNLTNCIKLSDISLLRLTPVCVSLTHLSLSYCEHISDTGVELLKQLPLLYSLDLTGCSVTDQGVASLPQLRHLGLAEIEELTNDGLQRMCSVVYLLETLDISDCEQISSGALQAIAYHCQLMRRLSLANCYQVGDDGVRCLTKGCKYLTHLDLSGCFITDKSLRLLGKECCQLRYIKILCCINVSRDEVQRQTRKGLQIEYNTDRPKHQIQAPIIPGLKTEQLIHRL